MLIEAGRLRAVPIAVSAAYTLLHDDDGARPGEIDKRRFATFATNPHCDMTRTVAGRYGRSTLNVNPRCRRMPTAT
jgi:hypothetical protein